MSHHSFRARIENIRIVGRETSKRIHVHRSIQFYIQETANNSINADKVKSFFKLFFTGNS